jgi:citrate lyase subunit beta/citryl-CoA lyase
MTIDIPVPPQDRCAPPPLRSALFVPGHRQRWVEPALASGADAVLFDLEDSVPAADLPAARRVVSAALAAPEQSGPRLMVRVAPAAAPELDADLDAVVGPGLHAVVVPLVQSLDDVRTVDDRLTDLERQRGIEIGSTVVMPIVETAFAARFCYEIAVSSRRIEYMGAGTSQEGDIVRALGFRWTPEGRETLTLRSWVLMSVRAAGVRYPITGLWARVDDLDGCRRWAAEARGLGYTGSMVIHPTHVPIVNDVFTPTEDEIARWQQVVELMAEHQRAGIGAFRLDGRMVDEADAKTAKENLALANRISGGAR